MGFAILLGRLKQKFHAYENLSLTEQKNLDFLFHSSSPIICHVGGHIMLCVRRSQKQQFA